MDKKVIIGGLIGIALIAVLLATNRNNQNNSSNVSGAEDQNTANETTISTTAKSYTSDKLGISFTYEPRSYGNFEVTVTEKDNKIYVHGTNEDPVTLGKVIEVFDKPSGQSLIEAIKERFLKNYSATDCFAEAIIQAPDDPHPDNYVFAEISYPPPTDSTQPFWQNADKCPAQYSKTNAVQYFMMNPDVPNKYVFLKLGQDSITTDGMPALGDGSRHDWSASVKIIK
jgi:hypothetical protein